MEKKRPQGVTVIAILAIIFNSLGIIGSLLIILGGGLLGALGSSPELQAQTGLSAAEVGGLGGIALLLGILTLVLSIAGLVFGIGALMLKPWAWMLGIGLYALNIIVGLFNAFSSPGGFAGQIIGLVVAGLILYYLFTPQVKAAFGRA